MEKIMGDKRTQIIKDIEKTKKLATESQKLRSVEQKYISDELARIEGLIRDHWPLTEDELSGIYIGVFAVRELEDVGGTFKDLASALEYLSYDLKHPDEE